MKSVNKAILLGNVGKDPEIKSTGGGTLVANLSLATTSRRKDKDGNWQDVTTWHNLVAFGRTAEIIRDYVAKGSKLFIEGETQNRSWDGKDGQKHYRTEVIVNDLSLLSEKTNAAPRPEAKPTAERLAEPWRDANGEITDDDIPF